MNNYDLYNAKMAESQNKRLLEIEESKEFILGRRIIHLKEAFPFGMIDYIRRVRLFRKRQRKISEIATPTSKRELYYADPEIQGYTGVAYTCITGGYDNPKEPLFADSNLRYELFSDCDIPSDSIWNYNKISIEASSTIGNYVNRYYKMHPFELFPNDQFSIYVDGNVQIASNVSTLFDIARKSRIGIAMHKHAKQNCIYKNALACEYNNRGNIEMIHQQMERYRREGFPEEFGLLEATIIIVDLGNDTAKDIMGKWWKEFIATESGRDQLSLPYVLWKNGYQVEDVGCLGNDEYHNPKFRISVHKGDLF